MSKLNDLIQSLCPKGVEFASLDQICSVETGKQLNREGLSESGLYPVINGGISNSGYWNEWNTEANTIAISQGGASAGYVNFITCKFWSGAHCYTVKLISTGVLYKYLYYFIKNKQNELMNSKQGAGIPGLNRKSIYSLRIPLPPLEVQEEIVRILDTFTDLEADLEAELEARINQYNYFREVLLKLENDTPLIELSNLVSIGDGLHGTPKYDESGNYYFINGNNVNNGHIEFYEGTKKVDDEAYQRYGLDFTTDKTLFMSINGTIGNVALYNNEKIVLGKSVAYFNIKSDKFMRKYLFYLLQSNFSRYYFEKSLTGSTIKNLGLKALRDYPISVPPLLIQEKVISILDHFSELVSDIKNGLPAEIAARHRQYEYYRNQLLTFKEKAV